MRIVDLPRAALALGLLLFVWLCAPMGMDAGEMRSTSIGTNAVGAKQEVKGGRAASPKPQPPETAPTFELQDQFDNAVSFRFPRSTPTVLTVADRAGSKQVDGWVTVLIKHFPKGLVVEGLADLSEAPGWLRGSIRKQFRADLPHPVMLDWQGRVARSFRYVAGSVNVYLIDRGGRIIHWTHGPAEAKALDELIAKTRAILDSDGGSASASVTVRETEQGSKAEQRR